MFYLPGRADDERWALGVWKIIELGELEINRSRSRE
jgi:hypothetical protein